MLLRGSGLESSCCTTKRIPLAAFLGGSGRGGREGGFDVAAVPEERAANAVELGCGGESALVDESQELAHALIPEDLGGFLASDQSVSFWHMSKVCPTLAFVKHWRGGRFEQTRDIRTCGVNTHVSKVGHMSIAHNPARRIPPSTLPLRLQQAREWRGFTQEEMAEVIGVSRATVSNYERGVGKKGISKLQVNAWAAFCDVDVEWLKTGVDETGNPEDDGTPGENSGKLRFDNLQHAQNVVHADFGAQRLIAA